MVPEDPSIKALLARAAQTDPKHIGLIMDGNGRWAQARGLSRAQGHAAGMEALRGILKASAEFGVPILTAYGFSSENWTRPQDEVTALMTLFADYLRRYHEEFFDQDCRFILSGRRHKLPRPIQGLIRRVEQETAACQTRLFNLAVSYGGRDELVDAVQCLARRVKSGDLEPEQIDTETISENLYGGQLPDPDLIIRTSGEHRLSGFLLWQSAYAELIFHDALWPDFTPELFAECINQYRLRERRFGGIVELA